MSFYETMFYFMCFVALLGWVIALYLAKQSDDYFYKFEKEKEAYASLRLKLKMLEDEFDACVKANAELTKPKTRAKKAKTIVTGNVNDNA